ncbi:MAG: SUMF1/EgtB/PvdO family nonheme iron enzyme, partial [Clostridia bacterium]|nr:SUMF1/EgtB/PvdO family nonheme iron enzyme [Clostridia bacterium]
KLYKELQVEYDSTIESIEKYGGFYIGRYETGDLSSKVPVVKRMNTLNHGQNWYTMYSKMKYLGANSNVKANMIWGSLWDETLQWLVDTECKTYEQVGTDSKSWGNYKNATFEYTTTGGSTSTKSASSSTRIPTGSTEYTNANNIYDMAGNVYEWTLEVYGTYGRRYRGGYYNFSGPDCPADYRYYDGPSYSDYCLGFRAYFYIK